LFTPIYKRARSERFELANEGPRVGELPSGSTGVEFRNALDIQIELIPKEATGWRIGSWLANGII
jgi:hypothetical protein